MRKMQKEILTEIVGKLSETHNEIKEYIKNRDIENAQAMLADCQNAALQLGDMIEKLECENCLPVQQLEKYCDELFNVYQGIDSGMDSDTAYKNLNTKIVQVEKSIENDIKVRLEVVFLPYKASMWDSLESVWKKANEDENCDVYVVPIPYFDRGADGKPVRMHYEGYEYPPDVPIVSWEKYNIAERKPDIIYIHNPYDDQNHVTSVHPKFYASELKKYTNELIYIPYFVAINDYVEKHFCVLPGTLYADKVIVQSEKVRRTYIKEFHKFERKNKCWGMFGDAEKKFLALGSPKFDKVKNSKLEDFEIPQQWNDLIIREDGSRKSVVLYNTTITAMLKDTKNVIKKIKDVISVFKKNSDVVLMWRPHPLLDTTLESMRPELLDEYRNIVEEYKRENIGIYDDSAELYRAITLSDAYYGDWSSVMELYKHTGKPIMIQNVDIIKGE